LAFTGYTAPPLRLRCALLLVIASVPLSACSSKGQGGDARGDLDRGIGEGIKLPDLQRGDGIRWTGNENVGASCDPATGTGCKPQAVCLDVGSGAGVCALPGCTIEDLSTPAIDDNCPTLQLKSGGKLRTVCTRGPTASGGQTYCLPACTPDPSRNDCQFKDAELSKKLACDPLSLLLNDHAEVCMFPACTKSSDCGNRNPLDPDATCDLTTGTCQVIGKLDVKVGAPCKLSTDCGAGQHCYPERKDAAGKVQIEGGYCTIVGCRYGGLWTCPAESKCFTIGSTGATVSLCLATGCKLSESCRPGTAAGQYACTLLAGENVCWIDVKSK
jgi:hypothetical protein